MTGARQDRAPTWRTHAIATLAALAALYGVVLVHGAGQTLLALTLLIITALALWTYTSGRTHALRYLFPGIAAAIVFVIFPMLYTIGIGFTNYSSNNLLDLDRARSYLQEDAVPAAGTTHGFTLHAAGAQFQLRVTSPDGDAAWATPPIALDAAQPAPHEIALEPADAATGMALPTRSVVAQLPALRALTLRAPGGPPLKLTGLREFAHLAPQVLRQRCGGIGQRLVLADQAAQLLGECLEARFERGVGLRERNRGRHQQ